MRLSKGFGEGSVIHVAAGAGGIVSEQLREPVGHGLGQDGQGVFFGSYIKLYIIICLFY